MKVAEVLLSRLFEIKKSTPDNDEGFFEQIIGAFTMNPFCNLQKDNIKDILQKLFWDCSEKIDSFKDFYGGRDVFSVTGEEIKAVKEAIAELTATTPSTVPVTPVVNGLESTQQRSIG